MNNNIDSKEVEGNSIEKDILNKEKAVLEAIKKKDFDCFSGYLSENYNAVYNQGIRDKKQEVKAIKQFDLKKYSISTTKFIVLSKSAVVLSYKAKAEAYFNGEDFSGIFFSSSLWVNEDERWQLTHHTSVREQNKFTTFSI